MESGKGRGRARGRGRQSSAPQKEQRPGEQPPSSALAASTSSAPPQSRAHYRGADRPGGLQARPSSEEVTGSVAAMRLQSEAQSESSNGNSNGKPVGRGLMRGRRELSQILWTRPASIAEKRGKDGTALQVVTNYFKIEKTDDWILCLYHVDFNPDEDRTGVRKRLLRQHTDKIGENYLFDGMQLYMAKKLPSEVTEFASKREDTDSVYQVRLKFIKELSPMDIQMIQIMNIILRRCLEHADLKQMGRNHYNMKAQTRIEKHGITIWPGFATSIRQHEYSLLLGADVTHKFLRTETVYQALKSMGPRVKQDCERLLGSVVMTVYNEKTYRIDDINFKLTPSSKFAMKGSEITYMEYYQKRYNVRIRDPAQPLLMSKPKKRDIRRGMTEAIYLVPELCMLTGLSDEMRKDFRTMKDLSEYMRMTPDKRVAALKGLNQDMYRNQKVQQELSLWGLKLNQDLVKVQARMLPDEKILQGTRNFPYDRRTSDWSREMRNLALSTPIDLNVWVCIYPARLQQDAKEVVDTLYRVASPMGMKVAYPDMVALPADHASEYINQLNNCAGVQLVMMILMNDKADRYSAIKKHASVRIGVPTQCLLARTISNKKRLMSVMTKVAIQINCKLGGDVWSVNIPLKNAMIIGYDAYHDSAMKGSSFGAVVSTYTNTYTKYTGQVARHKNREELTNNFSVACRGALQAYVEANKAYPGYVFVFRDGVGEGQLDYVKEHEIESIKECFKHAERDMPKFAFIVVSKRINTRILSDTGRGYGNPAPGTVVDDEITLPERYDFFLVSQAVNQGTVSPTSYNVIEDTTGLKPDHMQRLSYKLCHLYYNWQGTVRVPAPCLYAHKLAYLTGTSIHEHPHAKLRDKLWYL